LADGVVVVEVENILHRVRRDGKLSGGEREYVQGRMSESPTDTLRLIDDYIVSSVNAPLHYEHFQ